MNTDSSNKEVKRVISLPKAIKIMKDYKRNNFNAFKTLVENGYTAKYAQANSRYTIKACSDRIKTSLAITDDSTNKEVSETVTDLYAVIGLSKEEVLQELAKIIKQDINLAVKLRAMEPFVRLQGIKWDEKETQQAPQVVIKVDEVHNHTDIDSHSTIDIQDTVQTKG